MGRCFVIQPFDGGRFDKRFADVFKPAIEAVGLEPYRVDNDPSVDVPIDDIERGIREATICLADITLDNPNVWYEVGYAFAARKRVCLVCEENRQTKLHFDIQHRNIIPYRSESTSDFTTLRHKVSERLRALVEKAAELSALAETDLLARTDGLSAHDVAALTVLSEWDLYSEGAATGYVVVEEMERAGFTRAATSVAISKLLDCGLASSERRNQQKVFFITPSGRTWLVANQDKLGLRLQANLPDDISEADIHF